jgi:hypothetical protein
MSKPLTRKARLSLKTKELEKEKKELMNSLYYTYVGDAAKKLEKAGLVENAQDLRGSIVERLQKRQQEHDESAEGNRMIREIQAQQEEQRRREENAEANSMIEKIQAQQKLARQLMYEAEPRTRVKPRPSLRQLMKKTRGIGKVFRGYNALLTNHLENKQRKVENAEANSMIEKIQAQQKLARKLMYEAEPRTRVKPRPSLRQLMKKTRGIGKVNRGYNAFLSNHLEKKQKKEDVKHRIIDILGRKTNKNNTKNKTKTKTNKKYTV